LIEKLYDVNDALHGCRNNSSNNLWSSVRTLTCRPNHIKDIRILDFDRLRACSSELLQNIINSSQQNI